MSEAKYYISIPNKKEKKKIVYGLTQEEEEGNKLQFTAVESKDILNTTKKELMINLQVNGYDISKDPSYLK